MQGSLALEAQIKALKERTNIEAFAFSDEQILTKYQLVYLKNLTITEDAKEVLKLSGSIDIPQSTIAPKKKNSFTGPIGSACSAAMPLTF